MAVYPIKLLKDESGQPFVPLTSVEAVYGDKNLQYILDATQTSAGHFKIECEGLTLTDATSAAIAVHWPEITTVVKPSYLQLNNEAEKAIYAPDGTNYLDLEESTDKVDFVAYDGSKWLLVGNSSTGSGGHVITDGDGNTMEQQKILNFIGFNVENDNTNRATKIVNPSPINNLTTTVSGQGPLDAYQGHVLNDLITSLKSEMLLAAHPVGSYYWSEDATDPATIFGGTWEQIKDKFVIAVGDDHTVNTSYGSNTKNLSHTHTSAAHTHTVAGHTHTSAAHTHSTGNHTLTVSEIPSHGHQGRLYFHGYSEWTGGSSGGYYVFNWSSGNCIVNQSTTDTTSFTQLCNMPITASTGGSGAHNHGNTGSTTPGNTGSTSLTTNSTTPGKTGSSLASSFDITPACVAAYCWKRTA